MSRVQAKVGMAPRAGAQVESLTDTSVHACELGAGWIVHSEDISCDTSTSFYCHAQRDAGWDWVVTSAYEDLQLLFESSPQLDTNAHHVR